MRRILRIAAWNAALAAAGLALIAAASEIYLRAANPGWFYGNRLPMQFVPGVGRLIQPNADFRHTNGLDFWQTTRANSLGFLDREPLSPQDAAASCHVAVIGDSFVEANEVPIADKLHIRLEEAAADRLPALAVTASAYGKGGTGQINQLPWYDRFARALRPNLIVLVFVSNDFRDNSAVLRALATTHNDPEKQPYMTAFKQKNGSVALRPPVNAFNDQTQPAPSPAYPTQPPPAPPVAIDISPATDSVMPVSRFLKWIDAKLSLASAADRERAEAAKVARRAANLIRRPGYENILDGWTPTHRKGIDKIFRQEVLPPVFQDAVDYTAFALDEWKERTDRDGAMLVILSNYTMGSRGDPLFDRMSAMAQERGLPVIDQHAYIARQGRAIEDAHFQHDAHWNANGHLWAAESLMEWMERNQDVCGDE